MPPAARDRTPIRRSAWLATGLTACLLAPGCAGEWSGRRSTKAEPPLLGVADPAGVYPRGEVLADNTGRPNATRRAKVTEPSAIPAMPDELAELDEQAEAVEIARTSATARRDRPIQVTLLPPTDAARDRTPAATRPSQARPQYRDQDRTVAARRPPKPKAPPAPTPDTLLAEAKMSLEAMATYQVRLTRRERIGANLPPAEDVILSIRKAPRAVRLEWPEGPHKGRETIYVDGGPMHISQPNALVPRIQLDPNSPLVLRNSRHPITEAGFESILAAYERSLAEAGASRPICAGTETPEGFDHACAKVVKSSANGETRTIDFDPVTHLPALVELKAADGSLLESYRFKDVQVDPPALTLATAFDPDGRWGPAPGLFSRLAGTPANASTVQR